MANTIHTACEEKLAYDAKSNTLTTEEALSVLLGVKSDSEVKRLADILEKNQSSDLGGKYADKMKCLQCLVNRFGHHGHQSLVVRTPESIVPLFQGRTYGAKQECFMVAYLDGAHAVMDVQTITTGLLNLTLVHPREVFARAIELRSAAIIISHNHPSGNLTPSSEDLAMTRRIVQASNILGINVLDHIIVTTTGYHSMKESDEM